MMYRDDQEAQQQRLDATTREADRLRTENQSMRVAFGRLQVAGPGTTLALPPGAVYTLADLRSLPIEERARLAMHGLRPFPVWLIGVLNLLTFGLFPLIHFGLMHDRLPRASHNDPSAGKAIGYQFIPYYNLYWVFFSSLRLCDRLSLQLRLRGIAQQAPRGLVLATCIVTVIPYVNLVFAFPLLWTITVCVLQATVNRVARLSPTEYDATVGATPYLQAGAQAPVYPGTPGPAPLAAPAYPTNAAYPVAPGYPASPGYPPIAMLQPTPEQLARQARAKTLVGWSHVLGWGGLGVLIVGATSMGALFGAPAAIGVSGLAVTSMVVGAVIGQIGRGMQGRVI